MSGWLKNQWLKAQGVPDHIIWEGRWKNTDLFRVYPPHCVVCGRPWRPDKSRYIAVMGTAYREPNLGFLRWCAPKLGILDVPTGEAGASMRHLCTEHAPRWVRVTDCVTGEEIGMSFPPSRALRVSRDVRYWVGSVLRLVFLLGQWAWLWVAYKTVGHRAVYVRAPWPPVRTERV